MELDEEQKQRVLELTRDGESADSIAEKLGIAKKDVLETAELEGSISDLSDEQLQSNAFQMFDSGGEPVDLVKEGVCNIDEARLLFNKYIELKDIAERTDEKRLERVSTQVGLLGSRVARLELKLVNSYLLPKTRECSNCGHVGAYGVGVICSKCGDIDVEMREESSENYMGTVQNLVTKRDEDKDEDEG